MPAPINVELRGYLDFFGLKNGGMNPQMPAAFLQPAMDLQRWYMEGRVLELTLSAATIVATGAPTVLNFTSTGPINLVVGGVLQVPQNEVWVVLPGSRLQWTFTNVVGSSFDASYSFRTGAGSAVLDFPPMGDLIGFTTSEAHTRAGARTMTELYWLNPGCLVQFHHMGALVAAGQTIAIGASLRIVRLRV